MSLTVQTNTITKLKIYICKTAQLVAFQREDVDTIDPTVIHRNRTLPEGKTAKSANSSGVSAKNRNTKSEKTKNNVSVANLVNKILPGSTGGITPSGARKIGNSIGILPNQHKKM